MIVPVRNEEQKINALLENLATQEYASFEIIIVNDHSEDSTEQVIHLFNSPYVKSIQNEGTGKKSAISTGVAVASGQIVATTDADCLCHPGWLATINSFFSDEVSFAFGPVVIEGEGTLFSHIQQLEYASLVGTAAATVYFGFPTMSSAANMAFRKSAFLNVGGYEGNLHIPSGDDEFLMRKITKDSVKSLVYMADVNAIVKTSAQENFVDFLNQRIRWASKSKSNSSVFTVTIALFIIAVQISVLHVYLKIAAGDLALLAVIAMKFICELVLMVILCRFMKIKFRPVSFLVLFLVYPFYSLIVGVLSNFRGYSWKNRRYSRSFAS